MTVDDRSFICDDISDAQCNAFTILVVEDEPLTRLNITKVLAKHGFATLGAGTGEEALDLIQSNRVDLILLDIVLPGLNGFEVCRKLRGAGITTAIIMLTQLDTTVDIIRGLLMGADDYIVKPFVPDELIARIKAVLRRTRERAPSDSVVKFQGLILDFHSQKCHRGDKDLSLTPKEFALLTALCSNSGKVMSRSSLVHEVWGDQRFMSEKSLDVYIGRLRQKVEESPAEPSVIRTVRGHGYVAGPENN